MKNKKIILYGVVLFFIIIITGFLSVEITKLCMSIENDSDYKKLGLEIEDYNIEYCTLYNYARFGKYKVYKIKNYYSNSMDKFRIQLENSDFWNKNKFYEYMMQRFYEINENQEINIDREDVYYYNENGVYAIFDLKNAKLYYLEKGIFEYDDEHTSILGIKIQNYTDKEIYNVRSGPQRDGTDYYVYTFTVEKGQQIKNELDEIKDWSKEKLSDDILECFKYNEEIYSIENGYYYYKKICRTSDDNKKENFTDEEATGYEVCVYDIDKNILYYYWTSS